VIRMVTFKKMHEVRLPISGLTSPAGAEEIEHGLTALPGVSVATVDARRGHATVLYDASHVGLTSIVAVIGQAGCGVPRADRAVLRISTERSYPSDPASTAEALEASTAADLEGNDVAESGILHDLITFAMQQVEVPPDFPHGTCPGQDAPGSRRRDRS